MVTRYTLPSDTRDFMLFLDRFRLAVLAWTDVLDITSTATNDLMEDFTLLRNAVEGLGRQSKRISPEAAEATVRWRVSEFIHRLETHPNFTEAIARDLGICTMGTRLEFVYSAGHVWLPLSSGTYPRD